MSLQRASLSDGTSACGTPGLWVNLICVVVGLSEEERSYNRQRAEVKQGLTTVKNVDCSHCL